MFDKQKSPLGVGIFYFLKIRAVYTAISFWTEPENKNFYKVQSYFLDYRVLL